MQILNVYINTKETMNGRGASEEAGWYRYVIHMYCYIDDMKAEGEASCQEGSMKDREDSEEGENENKI